MFEVQEGTAREIFYAQHRQLQGRLRLDISGRSFPANREQPFDVHNARVAIGERVVQLVRGCAIEAVELGTDRAGFKPDAVPPAPDSGNFLLLMPNLDEFAAFVRVRLDRLFGLDPKSSHYNCALRSLAAEFYGWCQTAEARDDFQVNITRGTVSIRCRMPAAPLSPLKPAERVWTESLDS